MRNIYIVRHTESMHHAEKLGGGWMDYLNACSFLPFHHS
jgi:broad specificity phosphatase PhoE